MDVGDRPDVDEWSLHVVEALDFREILGHEVGDSPVLARLDLEIRKALAVCYSVKKVSEQYVEVDKWFCLGNVGNKKRRLAVQETSGLCPQKMKSQQRQINISDLH